MFASTAIFTGPEALIAHRVAMLRGYADGANRELQRRGRRATTSVSVLSKLVVRRRLLHSDIVSVEVKVEAELEALVDKAWELVA